MKYINTHNGLRQAIVRKIPEIVQSNIDTCLSVTYFNVHLMEKFICVVSSLAKQLCVSGDCLLKISRLTTIVSNQHEFIYDGLSEMFM